MKTPLVRLSTVQVIAARQWFHKKKENLGSPLGLSEAEVQNIIESNKEEYVEAIGRLMISTRSSAGLKDYIEKHRRSEKKLTELAERFRVSEAVMSELIEQVEDWLTSRA